MRRVAAILGFLALATLFVLSGCGGHSGSGSSASSSNHSDGRDSCPLTEFAPNYAAGITLAYWPQFPINIYFDTTTTSYTSALQAQAITAFNTWVDQTADRVEYNVVTSEADADVVVGFLPLSDPLLSSYDAEGITYFDAGSSSSTANADLRFEHVRCYIGIDGQTIRESGTMVHEFGHVLGIHGHSPDSQDVMYYAWLPTRSPIPTTRDINTLYTAYCGTFSRTATVNGKAVARIRTPMPPITAPGWVAIP